jgi:hypothetical protein
MSVSDIRGGGCVVAIPHVASLMRACWSPNERPLDDDRKGHASHAMTDLTPREILDAIRRGLEQTARRFGNVTPNHALQHPQPSKPTDDAKEPDSQNRR